ncbi:MAG: amphi-Trp domain-containing protein [Desulfovibrionaceae bacterium]
MGTKTTRMVGVMGVSEAADHLEALARQLRAGTLGLATAGRVALQLSPSVMLDVEIKASQARDREGVDVRLSWDPHHPESIALRGEF